MTLEDIIKCPNCNSEELKTFKNYKKCKECSTKVGIDGKGKTWYEYSIPIEKLEENG